MNIEDVLRTSMEPLEDEIAGGQYLPGVVLPDHMWRSTSAHSLATDIEGARRHFASRAGGDLIAELNNWLVTLKASQYAERDFMFFLNETGNVDRLGLDDLEDNDLKDLLVMADTVRTNLTDEFPGSEWVLGFNRGPASAIKKLHLHVTDYSFRQPIEAIEDEVRRKVLEDVMKIDPATKEAAAFLHSELQSNLGLSGLKLDGFRLKLPLEGSLVENDVLLRNVARECGSLCTELNQKSEQSDLTIKTHGPWGYSFTILPDNMLIIGISHRGFCWG